MKYELTEEKIETPFGVLSRIRALKDFADVKAGDLGGFIFCEKNLDQVYGNAWVYGNALVFGDAQVYGNALVFGDAQVFGNARVFGDARVFGNAQVFGNAWVFGDARVYGDAQVYGNAWVWFATPQVKFLSIGPIGDTQRNITITPDQVKAGCFLGTHAEFWQAVQAKYGDDGGDYARIFPLLNLPPQE